MGREEKRLLCDLGSELRLGRNRSTKGEKTTKWDAKTTKKKLLSQVEQIRRRPISCAHLRPAGSFRRFEKQGTVLDREYPDDNDFRL